MFLAIRGRFVSLDESREEICLRPSSRDAHSIQHLPESDNHASRAGYIECSVLVVRYLVSYKV